MTENVSHYMEKIAFIRRGFTTPEVKERLEKDAIIDKTIQDRAVKNKTSYLLKK